MSKKKSIKLTHDNAENSYANVVIQVSEADSTRAWALLVRHSPGTALPNRTFIVSEGAVKALRKARIKFSEIAREPGMPAANGVVFGERI